MFSFDVSTNEFKRDIIVEGDTCPTGPKGSTGL